MIKRATAKPRLSPISKSSRLHVGRVREWERSSSRVAGPTHMGAMQSAASHRVSRAQRRISTPTASRYGFADAKKKGAGRRLGLPAPNGRLRILGKRWCMFSRTLAVRLSAHNYPAGLTPARATLSPVQHSSCDSNLLLWVRTDARKQLRFFFRQLHSLAPKSAASAAARAAGG